MRLLLAVALLLISIPFHSQTPAQLQRAAGAALQAELAAEDKDCPHAKSTYDENICLGEVAEHARAHFKTFYQELSALLDAENRKPLDDAQSQWELYRRKTCAGVDHLYRGGTIRRSAGARCEIQLTRSRMRDLDSIYHSVLHN